MAANGYTVVSNDPRAPRLTGVNRHEMQDVQAGASTDDKTLDDEGGPVSAFGRGAADKTITYLALYRNGTKCYININAALNGIEVSTVKP